MKAAIRNYHVRMQRVLNQARDFPIYCQRLSFFPEVPEHEVVAELFLPLK
jgi:AraC family transcriptional regulator